MRTDNEPAARNYLPSSLAVLRVLNQRTSPFSHLIACQIWKTHLYALPWSHTASREDCRTAVIEVEIDERMLTKPFVSKNVDSMSFRYPLCVSIQ